MAMGQQNLRNKIAELIPKLRAIARGLTGQQGTADDLVQSTLERALQRLGHVHDETRIDRWLYTILHSQWVDEIRRSNRNKQKLIQFTIVQNIDRKSNSAADAKICRSMDVERAMARLVPEQREAVTLVHLAGYNYSEVSEMLGVPIGTVASRVARARQALAESLKATPRKRPAGVQSEEG